METFKLKQGVQEDGNGSIKQHDERRESQAEGPGHAKLRGKEVNQEQICDQCGMRGEGYME